MSLTKVEMSLTDLDIANAEKIKEALGTGNKAEAVSSALSISAALVERIRREELYVRDRDGAQRRVTMDGPGS